MAIRYAIIGMPGPMAKELTERLESMGAPVVVFPRLPPDVDYIARQGTQLALVSGYDSLADGIEASRLLAKKMEVVLLAAGTDTETLRAAMRAGCADVVDAWKDMPRLKELFGELANRILDERGESGRVIAVLGCQGGVGATSVTVALGHLLSQDPQRRTVVTDMDVSSGDLLAALDLRVRTTTDDLLRGTGHFDVYKVQNLVERHPGGFWVLPQPPEDLDSVSMTQDDARDLLSLLTRAFTDIVIDMGSSLGETGRRVALLADDVILVSTQEVPPLRKALRRLNILKDMGVEASRIHVVLNRYHARRYPTLDEVVEQLRHPVMATISNDYQTVHEALDASETVFETSPRSAVARDLKVLKARLMGEKEPEPSRRGWFR